jgi:selenocysteine-specific translation elongation factor
MNRGRLARNVPGLTACLLGNLAARREVGKVGTQSDIHLHELKEGDRQITVIVPDRYPDQLKPLSYAVLNCDAAVLVVDKMGPQVGEQILAADAAGITHGAIVLQNYLQPDQLKPALKGTTLESWPLFTDEEWPKVRAHLAAAPARAAEGFVMVPVDHHFNVKGVGAVILGVVKQGVLKKGETLYAYPGKVICPVRSIQVHDVDHDAAHPGDRVGLALRNTNPEHLDRGMVLAPADAPVKVHEIGATVSFKVQRGKFARSNLKSGGVAQLGVGMQFVPIRLTSDPPAPGQEGVIQGVVEKAFTHAPGEKAVLWHADAAPQRVVGRVTL